MSTTDDAIRFLERRLAADPTDASAATALSAHLERTGARPRFLTAFLQALEARAYDRMEAEYALLAQLDEHLDRIEDAFNLIARDRTPDYARRALREPGRRAVRHVHTYDRDEIGRLLLAALARNPGLTLSTVQVHEHDNELSLDVQWRILPEPPLEPGITLSGSVYQRTRSSERPLTHSRLPRNTQAPPS